MPSADDCERGLEPPKTHKASINESQASLARQVPTSSSWLPADDCKEGLELLEVVEIDIASSAVVPATYFMYSSQYAS
jgi:hypothetical protein